jgi:Ca-activated chloride channel homolog
MPMKLRTLMLLSATGMIATGAVVWTSIEPARRSATAGNQPATGEPVIQKPKPPPIDLSQFQAGKTLMVEGRLGHAVLPANLDSETYLFLDVSGAAVVAANPPPLDLSIVIDKSGSMAGKRITNALAAAKTAIERLRDGDVVSVVAFNTQSEVAVRPTRIDFESRKRVLAQLATIRVGGDTCISCGIDTSMGLLNERTGMVKRILVLSDGVPDGDRVRDIDGFRQLAENCRRMGASITTIGVDLAYDEKVMSTIARSSNGHHYFVADPSGLATIFDQEMSSLTKTVANNAELTVDLAPGVFVEHVFDRAVTNNGSQLVVPLGTFSAGDHKTLLVRLRVPRGAAGERSIAAVRLRYDDLAESKAGSCEGKLATRLSSDTNELTPLDGLVSGRVSATETATTLQTANDLFNAGHADQARGLIQRQKAKVEQTRATARNAAPVSRRPDVDRSFDKTDGVLGGADSGFHDPSPANKGGKTQVKKNQADSLHLSD